MRAGRLEEARGPHLGLLPANRAVAAAFGTAARKAAMDMLGCHGGEPRMPLVPLAEGEGDGLGRILGEAGGLP